MSPGFRFKSTARQWRHRRAVVFKPMSDFKSKFIPISLQFFSVTEAALIMGVSKKSVYEWVNDGSLPAFNLGNGTKQMRIRQQDLEAFIEKHRISPSRTDQGNQNED